MQGAYKGEQQERGGSQITGKENGKGRVAHHQHQLSWEGVDDETAERPEQQGCDGIARQHQSDDILRRAEMLLQIEGQQRREDVEGEKQREICHHHLTVILVPKSFLGHNQLQK